MMEPKPTWAIWRPMIILQEVLAGKLTKREREACVLRRSPIATACTAHVLSDLPKCSK